MIKYYCDKCKKETSKQNAFLIQIKGITKEDKINKHLCCDCLSLLKEFIEGESNGIEVESDGSDSVSGKVVTRNISLSGVKPMEKLMSKPPEPADTKGWKPSPMMAERLQKLYSNSLTVEEYSALVGKSKISVALKCAIVNLYMNGEAMADIAHDLGVEYVTAYQTCNAFRGKLRPIEPSPGEFVDINNLLKAGWKIRDISEDQGIDILKVTNAYMQRFEEGR